MKKVSYFEELTTPSGLVVTLDELKAWLKIDGNDEDNELTFILTVAQDKVSSYINQQLLPYTARGNYVDLQCNQLEKYPFISFKRFPVRSLTSVELWDGDSYEAMAATSYELKPRSYGFDRVVFFDGVSSAVSLDKSYPIRITADVGYATPSDVPAGIKMAIRQYASHLYDNRGDCSDCECDSDGVPSMPKLVRASLKQFRLREAYA